jgi:ABC-2 type transport system ATP-binding protein
MLEVKDIVKQYAKHRALDGVSFSIRKGSIFGLLGPNGAGKTSLIRIINQITAPDEGQIIFDGEPLNENHISRIGYLPEERGLYKKMMIGEQMLYLAQLKGLSKNQALERSKAWFERMEMETWWDKKIEDLSKGMQQKVQFVATVIHEPELIILDEPFSGFDPVNVDIIKKEILKLNEKGATIIFSTHRMESVEELCDSIVLINKSKKILDGKVSEIRNTFRTNTFRLGYQGQQPLPPSPYYNVLSSKASEHGSLATIEVLDGTSVNQLLTHLIPQVEIQEITEVMPSIHDIFVKQVTANH